MLTETSLTNTLSLSGITNIRYRSYTQSYQKSALLSFLTCRDLDIKSPSYIKSERPNIPLLDAFRHLVHLNIPSVWQIVQAEEKDLIALQLWVFWINDKHTGIIDNNRELNELQELKVGSFNWDQLTSNELSLNASPQLNQTNTAKQILLVPGIEYKLFIKSIRNLIHTSMIERNTFPLGEFFILPDTCLNNNIIDDSGNNELKNTMLACTYNVYLTSSNLVFQPNTRRMRIRPLTSQDAYSKNMKVLLCPTGEYATLVSFDNLPTIDLRQKALEQWAAFYHINSILLQPPEKDKQLPSLITIRTLSNAIITYPTMLVFVPTDTKLTPSAVSGLNGIMGLNHAMTEDLGGKLSRFKYHEASKDINSNEDKSFIDYWSYRDPIIFTGNTIIDSLSMMDTNYHQDQIMLHKALVEPIVSSPIMNSKSVIPIHSTLTLGNTKLPTNDSILLQQYMDTTLPKPNTNINMDLMEFTMSQFNIKDELVDTILDSLNPLDDPNIALNNNSRDISSEIKQDVEALAPPIANPEMDSNSSLITLPQNPVNNEPSEIPPPSANDFDLMYDMNTNTGKDVWDINDDFDDLDLDVTEADFDFFKTPAAPSVITPNNILNIMPMEISPVVKEEQQDPVAIESPTIKNNQYLDVKEEAMEITPNNDSLFTPFVISNDTTQDVSLDNSNTTTNEPSTNVTPAKVEYTQPSNDTFVLKKRVSYQKLTPESFTFVPPDFLPVPINTTTIDAKYNEGGKFMYNPSSSNLNKERITKDYFKKGFYTPDYIPPVKKNKAIRPKVNQKKQEQKKALPAEDVDMLDVNNSSDSGSSSSGSSNSGSDSDESESDKGSHPSISNCSSNSTTSNDSEPDYSSDHPLMSDQLVDKRLRTMKRFQRGVVQSILRSVPASLPTDRLQNIDYDTPFAPVLANGCIKPIKWRQSEAMEQSLEYLCQQAVWGGYPFSSGLAEVSANGGEIEGETSKVLVARRTNMMQVTRGVVTHVPSLSTDLQQVTNDFKNMLKQVFVEQSSAASNTTDSSVDGMEEEISLPTMTYLNGPLLGSVDVKGPLTIQQYYNLNESHSQSHSKYGKYQIKKKRPDEPNLDTLKQPDIVVSRYEDSLEGSPTMLPFWEKLGLQPYSSQKQVDYLVLYPDNPNIEHAVYQFFKILSSVYDSCHLGKHDAYHTGRYRNGLVPVPLPATGENETGVKQRFKSYEDTCETLGKLLASSNDGDYSQNKNAAYTVIYMVNPGPHMSSYLDMGKCFYKLKESYNQTLRKNNHRQLVLQLVPIEHVLRSSTFGGYSMWGMKDIAFSVYTKCFTTVAKKHDPKITTSLYAPPFVLSKTIPKTIQFKLDDIRPFPVILDQNASLHLAYCFSYNRAWMSAVWIDGRGELLEYAIFPRKSAYKDAWERTLKIAKSTDFPWTIVITKLGLMFNDELLHWLKYTQHGHKYWLNIVGLDLESGLNLHFDAIYPDHQNGLNNKHQQPPTLLDSFGRSISSVGTGYKQDADSGSGDDKNKVNEAQMLLLNHRISYSQKRERAYKGILRTEAISEKENWMTPLATGYLIHSSLPNKNVNPCMEQFNNEPFVAEVHLVYNHTQHSAYSTLQDIIKKFHALSFVNPVPSSHSCIPFHVVLAERLSRLLLVVDDSLK